MGWGRAGARGLITRGIRLYRTSFSSRALSSSIIFSASWIMLLSILTDFASWINECCNRKKVIQIVTLLIIVVTMLQSAFKKVCSLPLTAYMYHLCLFVFFFSSWYVLLNVLVPIL